MKLVIIAAIGENNELGKGNSLIWHLPGDLKFFKDKTYGKSIVMGRKTFESLPKMLPNRHHIVITSGNINNPDVEVYHSIESFLNSYSSDEETFVIGGASIYKAFIDIVDTMYLTEVEASCESADAFFPDFDKNDWQRSELTQNSENGISYKHILYKRR